MPELFAVLRGVVDIRRRDGEAAGQFLLLGSATGVLLQQASESLAGRIAQLELTPFQAREVLPALLAKIAPNTRPWMFGHSDGGSIALIHAALFPEKVAGAIVAAPHIFVEDVSIASITQTRETYLQTDFRNKLARYHDDPDSAFWGWNDIWLDPAFRAWTIEALLPQITCPLIAIQGIDDEYGTMAQIDGIARAVSHAQLIKLEHCGHSPHRDQPQAVIDIACTALNRLRRSSTFY